MHCTEHPRDQGAPVCSLLRQPALIVSGLIMTPAAKRPDEPAGRPRPEQQSPAGAVTIADHFGREAERRGGGRYRAGDQHQAEL